MIPAGSRASARRNQVSSFACASPGKAACSVSAAPRTGSFVATLWEGPASRLGGNMVSVSAAAAIRRRFSLERVFKDLVAGAVCGFLAIVLSISFGSLLLPAELHEFLPAAIGMALFSTMVAA